MVQKNMSRGCFLPMKKKMQNRHRSNLRATVLTDNKLTSHPFIVTHNKYSIGLELIRHATKFTQENAHVFDSSQREECNAIKG